VISRPSQAGLDPASSPFSLSRASEALVIEVGDGSDPPTPQHRMLLEFVFGDVDPEQEQEAAVHIPLRTLGGGLVRERWWYKGDVWRSDSEDVVTWGCDDFVFTFINLAPEYCQDIRKATEFAYQKQLEALSKMGEFQLARVWNYLGGINEGRDDHERYRQFSIGRAKAFEAHHIPCDCSPVGTAIGGTAAFGLRIVGLASKAKFHPVENPRQVSAFDYPRRYGPRSPRFSRSGIVDMEGSTLYLVSGTAAVLGHESVFPYDTASQIEATLDNLEALSNAASGLSRSGSEVRIVSGSCLRVYVRKESDYPLVHRAVSERLPAPECRALYLRGDICRRELMVEIELSLHIAPRIRESG